MSTITRWLCTCLMLACCRAALSAAPALPGPDRLPADTWVVVNWHGVASANQVRTTNAIVRMWNDPEFASLRDRVVAQIASLDPGAAPDAARAKIDDVMAMLENPIVIGIAGDPFTAGPSGVHLFAVVNTKGKEAEWTRLHESSGSGAGGEISSYAFRGLQVRKTVKSTMPAPAPGVDPVATPPQPKISTRFETTLGDYALYSDNQFTMESLITRLQNPDAGDSLLQNAIYQRAQRFRAEGPMLEMFLKMPDLSALPLPDAPSPGVDMKTTLRELHLERLQGLWFSTGMARDRMVIRGALLADMSPGSVLDLIGGNVAQFQTLAAAPVDETFGAFRLDLPALYDTVLRAIKAGLPPDQGAAAGMMLDTMAMSQTGMRAAELLALFSGEIALSGNATTPDSAMPRLVMLPVANSTQVLALARRLAGPLILGDEITGGATVLTIASPGQGPEPAGDAPSAPKFLAITPRMLMLSDDRAQIDAALARDASDRPPAAGSLAADATFRSARSSLPDQLNGISYTDFARVRWDAAIQSAREKLDSQRKALLDRAAQAEQGQGDVAADPATAEQLRAQAASLDSFGQLLLDSLPLLKKHLRISAGGSWKAGDGMYFDSFMN